MDSIAMPATRRLRVGVLRKEVSIRRVGGALAARRFRLNERRYGLRKALSRSESGTGVHQQIVSAC